MINIQKIYFFNYKYYVRKLFYQKGNKDNKYLWFMYLMTNKIPIPKFGKIQCNFVENRSYKFLCSLKMY